MDHSLDTFWAVARNVRLSPMEKASCLEGVRQGMTFVHATEGIVLNPLEKDAAREAIVAFMGQHPLPDSVIEQRAWADLFSFFLMPLRFSFASALVLFLLLGAGGVYAAEGALPGDFLYPIKVDVLEPLRERLLVTPEARSTWAVHRVERRMEEAKMLVERGRFTPDRRAVIEKRIVEHVARAEEEERSDAPMLMQGAKQADQRDVLSEKIESFQGALRQERPKATEANDEFKEVVHFLEEVHRNVREKKRKDHPRPSSASSENDADASSEHSSSFASSHTTEEHAGEDREDVPSLPMMDKAPDERHIPKGRLKDLP